MAQQAPPSGADIGSVFRVVLMFYSSYLSGPVSLLVPPHTRDAIFQVRVGGEAGVNVPRCVLVSEARRQCGSPHAVVLRHAHKQPERRPVPDATCACADASHCARLAGAVLPAVQHACFLRAMADYATALQALGSVLGFSLSAVASFACAALVLAIVGLSALTGLILATGARQFLLCCGSYDFHGFDACTQECSSAACCACWRLSCLAWHWWRALLR